SYCLSNIVGGVVTLMVLGTALIGIPCLGVCAAPLFLFWLYSFATRWRLIWAAASRLATAISARRQTGDWDLIRLIPMPKIQWLYTQFVAIGWQIWPLVKALVLAQWGITTVFYILLVVETSAYSSSCYAEPCMQRLSGLTFFLVGLPVLLIWISIPLLEMGLIVSVSSLVSSYISRPGFAIAASFIGVLVTRLILGIIGWIVVYLLYGELADRSVQYGGTSHPILPSLREMVGITLFWEWLPAIGLGEISTHRALSFTEHAEIYGVVLSSVFLSYIVVPLGLIHVLFKWAVYRLDRG
ncbi:MAG: hypothetical protein K8I82_04390, partial [Anaerolineae bacterium]|nr:hypothetical protein [Anaerolineae bacterium]